VFPCETDSRLVRDAEEELFYVEVRFPSKIPLGGFFLRVMYLAVWVPE
jgi:hypothetical protein